MLPSANSKNTLFTYNFQHSVTYKKFFNNNNPNNLVFSSGLFGGCLFSSDITVSVLRDFEIPPDSVITEISAQDSNLIEEAEEALETMEEPTETTQIEDEPVSSIPKAKLKLVDVFSSYLSFLRKSVFHVTRGKRAKVITWCKGKPTVKYLEESFAEEALEKVGIHGEYMPFDRSDMIEDHEIRDLGYSSQYPHVWSAFENRLHFGDGDATDVASTNEVLAEQFREVGGYFERMGDVFETETGELAIQFPHIISDFETYRSVCVDTLKYEYEDENHEETELEGSVSYASASWNSCEVYRDHFLQLEDERFDDLESLDCMSYKSFDFDDEDSDEIPKLTNPSEVTARKLDSDEDNIMYPEMGGFNEIIEENHDGDDEIPWEGSGRDGGNGQALEQIKDVLEKFQDYTTNDVPNRVEKEIYSDTVDYVNNPKSAEQLPKVMLKWLGHFWGLEDELSPTMESVSKFQHVFTPLKVAATK